MGAHPRLPSEVLFQDRHFPLNELIHRNPKVILGKTAARQFKGELPFLFKLLAVNQPLSLQAHPDRRQARQGYHREVMNRIPLHAENRNFKDPNSKPEMICALTPFWILCGFRPVKEILTLMRKIQGPHHGKLLKPFCSDPSAAGLKRFFSQLMLLEDSNKLLVLSEILSFSRKHQKNNPVFSWVMKLHRLHPQDIGIIAPLLLNVIHLKTDEALFSPPCQLHSYLKGFGIELMGNSDNVLRGGLTSKHLDVEGLIRILNFSPSRVQIIRPISISEVERILPTPSLEFSLSIITLKNGKFLKSQASRNVEIMICLKGDGVIQSPNQKPLTFRQGMSWVIPASAGIYTIRGNAKIYKSTVPNKKGDRS